MVGGGVQSFPESHRSRKGVSHYYLANESDHGSDNEEQLAKLRAALNTLHSRPKPVSILMRLTEQVRLSVLPSAFPLARTISVDVQGDHLRLKSYVGRQKAKEEGECHISHLNFGEHLVASRNTCFEPWVRAHAIERD